LVRREPPTGVGIGKEERRVFGINLDDALPFRQTLYPLYSHLEFHLFLDHFIKALCKDSLEAATKQLYI